MRSLDRANRKSPFQWIKEIESFMHHQINRGMSEQEEVFSVYEVEE